MYIQRREAPIQKEANRHPHSSPTMKKCCLGKMIFEFFLKYFFINLFSDFLFWSNDFATLKTYACNDHQDNFLFSCKFLYLAGLYVAQNVIKFNYFS